MKTYKQFFHLLFLLSHACIFSQTSAKPSAISTNTAATTGVVYLDLEHVKSDSGYIDIPVSFSSTDSIVALDFALRFNENVLNYSSIVSWVPYLTDILAKYSRDDKTLRFTSNSKHYYIVNQTIATLRFNKTGLIKDADLFGFVGYLNGDRVNTEIRGHFPFRTCSLKFWSDNNPIIYNPDDADHYLITNIYGVNSNCSNRSLPTQPDLNGQFSYASANGPFVQIERDILPSTDVQPVINDFDVGLGNKILVNDTSFVPSIYQMIALDVNADGVISAGDISQINQRSVKTISEFKQKWNYNINGTASGEASKDWLFLNAASIALPAYQISATYPYNDGVGYSRSRVPIIPFCLPAPDANVTETTYTGVLLGDANGNYAVIANDGKIK